MKNRLESLLALLEKDRKDSFIIYGIALEYKSLKEFKEAEKYFSLLLESNPDYVPTYMQYAQLKERLNQLDEAKSIFKIKHKKSVSKAGTLF